MSDYSRFAVKPGDQVLSQLIIVPIFGTVTCFIGIVCTSVAKQTFPDHALLWQPYALLQAVQENGGSGARAAVFFASLAFLCSQLGINIACNAVSGGIDLASLFPKYINIRRGAFIVSLLSITATCLTPRQLLWRCQCAHGLLLAVPLSSSLSWEAMLPSWVP